MNSLLIILMGPSAAGKTRLQKQLNLPKIVTTTTRSMRSGEKEGVDYFFMSPENFVEKLDKGDFIEWTQYSGSYYGIQKNTIEKSMSEGMNQCLILDRHGAQKMKAMWPEKVMIIGVYAMKKQIETRLLQRNEPEIEKRLSQYEEEMQAMLALSDIIYHSNDLREETVKIHLEQLLANFASARGLTNPL